MSMLSIQIAKLRKAAESIDWEIPEAAELLREAADTIEDLRDRLQNQAFALGMQEALGSGTCEIESKIFIEGEYVPCPYYEYEMECGGQFRWDDPEPPNFCPNCGRKVVSA